MESLSVTSLARFLYRLMAIEYWLLLLGTLAQIIFLFIPNDSDQTSGFIFREAIRLYEEQKLTV